MDDAGGVGALLAVGVDVAHHIMADLLLTGLRHLIVDIVLMCDQLLDLFIADIQSQLLLALCQRDPQPAPGTKLLVVGKQLLHLLAGITLCQRALVNIVHACSPYRSSPRRR